MKGSRSAAEGFVSDNPIIVPSEHLRYGFFDRDFSCLRTESALLPTFAVFIG